MSADARESNVDRTLSRVCRDCGESKPGTDFNWRKVNGKGPYAMSYCKACYRIRYTSPVEKEKAVARTRAYREKTPTAARSGRSAYLVRTYGVTADEVDALIASQGGGCAICGSPDDLHVDHCHEVGLVRGVLCGRCNRGLGMFKDDPSRLAEAIGYLLRFGGTR